MSDDDPDSTVTSVRSGSGKFLDARGGLRSVWRGVSTKGHRGKGGGLGWVSEPLIATDGSDREGGIGRPRWDGCDCVEGRGLQERVERETRQQFSETENVRR